MKYFSIALLLFLFLIPSAHAVSDRFGVKAQGTVSATITSTKMLDSNAYRQYLMIQNLGGDSVIIKFGSVQTGQEGIWIPAGGNYEPTMVPTDSIWFESATGSQAVHYVEGI